MAQVRRKFTGRKYPPPKRVKALINFLGMEVWGNLGSWTIWRTPRGSLVVAERFPRYDPRSPLQLECRRRFKKAHDEFMSLSRDEQRIWEEATKRLGLVMTGKNFYLHIRLTGFWTDYDAAAEALGYKLPLPDGIEYGSVLE